MHDNPQAASRLASDTSGTVFAALSDHRIVALTGRDAVAFAQAQFMNDVAALHDGRWQWSGWLTPKGRVIALFALLRLDTETLWLVLPDVDADAFAAALRRFVFRSKVAIALRDDLTVAGAFSAIATEPDRIVGEPASGLAIDMGGDGGARTLRMSTQAGVDEAGFAQRWRAFDLAHGLPRLPASQAGHWTPQQLSLERLRAFSVKKGCYPGQEIVSRTHFLGKAKRGLVLVEGDAASAVGAELRSPEGALGPVIAAAVDGTRHLALAVVALEREPLLLSVDGAPVREFALAGGLAR